MVATASATVLIHPMAVEPALWWGLRIVSGGCFAVLYVVIESWLSERSTNASRGAVFAIYVIISFLMLSLGQMPLVLAPVGEYPLFLLSSILLSIAAAPAPLTAVVVMEAERALALLEAGASATLRLREIEAEMSQLRRYIAA